ncbi:MAG: hypothetical protein Ta2D_12750 [Rickettsiales bacterium]|nr:MAG: hypothetical protein Ta2D_12750 [Rickettsiales bacterium]
MKIDFSLFKDKRYTYLFLSNFTYWLIVTISLSFFPIILTGNLPINGEMYVMMGISAGVQKIIGLLSLLGLPFLLTKCSLQEISKLSIILYAIPLVLMPFYINLSFWFLLVISFGIGTKYFSTLLFSTSNIIFKNEKRGTLNGIMNVITLIAISFPYIVYYFTKNIYFLFILCFLLSILNLYFFSKLDLECKEIKFAKNLNFKKYFGENYLLYISNFIYEFISASFFVYTMKYAENNGWNIGDAGMLLSVYTIVGGIFSIPTGWVYDKKRTDGVLILATLITCLCAICVPDYINSHFMLFVIYGILGISTGFVYLGSYTILNSKYQKEELVSANATLNFCGGIARISSNFIMGYALKKSFDYQIPSLFTLPIAILSLIYITLFIVKYIKLRMQYKRIN